MNLRPKSPIRLSGVVLFCLLGSAVFAAAAFLDRPVYRLVRKIPPRETARNAMFYYPGYLPVWLLAATALFLIDVRRGKSRPFRNRAWRAAFLAGTVTCSAIVGETLKFLIRRLRPNMTDGAYVFRAWSQQTFETSGLGMPSGHAVVAFAAAWALCFLFPEATAVWLLVAIACAASRVLLQSHFVSDVAVGAILSFVIVRMMWQLRPKGPDVP